MSSSFRDLRVWQNAMRLASDIYRATAVFPKHELYGLSQQMRRAAVSTPSNIAEGKGHRSNKGFLNFLFHARGSLLIAQGLKYLPQEPARRGLDDAAAVGRSLSGLFNSLDKPDSRGQSRALSGTANDQRPRAKDRAYV